MKLLLSNSMKDLPDHKIHNFQEEPRGVVAVGAEDAVGVVVAAEGAGEDTTETEIETTGTTSLHRASGYQQMSQSIPLATREAPLEVTTHQTAIHGLQPEAQNMDQIREIHIQDLTQDQTQDMEALQIRMQVVLPTSQAHTHKILSSTPTRKATQIPTLEAHINNQVLINTVADTMLVITPGSYPLYLGLFHKNIYTLPTVRKN